MKPAFWKPSSTALAVAFFADGSLERNRPKSMSWHVSEWPGRVGSVAYWDHEIVLCDCLLDCRACHGPLRSRSSCRVLARGHKLQGAKVMEARRPLPRALRMMDSQVY